MKSLGLTARSETRKGFTMPSHKKISSVLRTKSKAFIIGIVLTAFALLTKTNKIKLLIKIERGVTHKIRKAVKKRRTKSKKRKTKRKSKRKTKKKSKSKSKKKGKQRISSIKVPLKGGGFRRQRVLILASGKRKFIKNK